MVYAYKNSCPERITSIDVLLREAKCRLNNDEFLDLSEGPVHATAFDYYQKALECGRGDVEIEYQARKGMALYLESKSKLEEATSQVLICLDLNPSDISTRLLLARLYEAQGLYKAASKEFLQASRLSRVFSKDKYSFLAKARLDYLKDEHTKSPRLRFFKKPTH
jgi:tetratricopeptide (TPR) repeat protein